MTFTPPTFTPYPWQNDPSQATPLDKDHLQADYKAVVSYTWDLIQAYDTYLQTSVNGIPGFDGGASGAPGTRIKSRRDTAANWTANNPVLLQGEPGWETDTGYLKIGDGSTAWSTLTYHKVPTSALPSTAVTAGSQATAQSLGARSNASSSNGIVWINEKLTLADPRWNAKFDGATDDTAAWNAASVAGGTGAVIEVPSGTSIVNGFAPAATEQRFHGFGRDRTVLRAKTAATYTVDFTGLQRCGLQDLTVDGNAKASHGLKLSGSGSVASQQHSIERVNFNNCNDCIDVLQGTVQQADKNLYKLVQFENSNRGMLINSINGQQQLLLQCTFDTITNDAITLTAGGLVMYGGQVQTATNFVNINGANVPWVTLEDVITEGTTTDILSTGGNFATGSGNSGVFMRNCILQGTSFVVDPGTSSAGVLVGIQNRFNNGALGRATSSDFTFVDIFNTFSGGAAWVPITNFPRRFQYGINGVTFSSHAGEVDGIAGSSVPWTVNGASGQSSQLQNWKVNGAIKSEINHNGAFVSDSAADGIVLKDTQGTPHYWRVTVGNTGTLTTTDLGTTRPD